VTQYTVSKLSNSPEVLGIVGVRISSILRPGSLKGWKETRLVQKSRFYSECRLHRSAWASSWAITERNTVLLRLAGGLQCCRGGTFESECDASRLRAGTSTYHFSTPPSPLTLVVPSRADSFLRSLGDLRGTTGWIESKELSISKQGCTGTWGRGSTPGDGTRRRKRRFRHQTRPLGRPTS